MSDGSVTEKPTDVILLPAQMLEVILKLRLGIFDYKYTICMNATKNGVEFKSSPMGGTNKRELCVEICCPRRRVSYYTD